MPVIFEYGQWAQVADTKDLKRMLQIIWNDRPFNDLIGENPNPFYQPFLQFDGELVRARNFSGFIQRDNELIEIYPKVFREQQCQDKRLMLRHVFYWLSYCRKWKFPFAHAGLDKMDIDSFPELIINLIANQVYETIISLPFAQYQPVEEALATPRGNINFSRYINQSLSRSHYHKIECDYEPFVFDNKVNRTIKYCCRLLLSKTMLPENVRILQDVINYLDEVTDTVVTIQELESMVFNHFYDDYSDVIDSCKLILGQHSYSGSSYDLSQWCLLLPMEYIFEDFLAGFMETHFRSKWKVYYQKSDMYLSDHPQVFNMQHDIFLEGKNGKKLLIDAKYKIRPNDFKSDSKKGVSQSDLYQMVSYAFRRGCNQVIMIYPNIGEEVHEPDVFEIFSGFENKDHISIKAIELPVWSVSNFQDLEAKLKNAIGRTLS